MQWKFMPCSQCMRRYNTIGIIGGGSTRQTATSRANAGFKTREGSGHRTYNCRVNNSSLIFPVTTYANLQFQQCCRDAMQAAASGPVFISTLGRTTHVLLSIEHFRRLNRGGKNIAELLAMPGSEIAEFETPIQFGLAHPAHLD